MPRFLHTADLQLGMTRRHLAPGDQARYTDARIEAIYSLARLARGEATDAVVVAGDVFDHNLVTKETICRSLEAMAQIPCPVLLVPGNHDAYDASSVYRMATFVAHRPANVHVLHDATPFVVRPGFEVVGAAWPNKRPLTDLVDALARRLEPTGAVRVLVGHGIVDVMNPDQSNLAAISLAAAERALVEGRYHYLALGDRHSLTQVGTSGRIWYSGTPEATDFDEVRPGFVLKVELDQEHIDVTEHEVGTWHFRLVECALDGDADIDRFGAQLAALPDKSRTVLKYILKGTLTIKQNIRLQNLLADVRPKFAAVIQWDRHTDLALCPDDLDFGDMALSGFAQTALESLVKTAAADETSRDALALLYRLSTQGGN